MKDQQTWKILHYNFSGLQETIENTLFHDDVNSGNAPLRRLFERRITNTSFNSIQFKWI